MKVSIDELSDKITNMLDEYKDLTGEKLKEAVKSASKTVKENIESTAPVRSGRYAKSWKIKNVSEGENTHKAIVHSRRYQIAHLLENGHAKRGGGRVAGRPHIKSAEEIGIKEFEEKIKEGFGG